MVRDLDENQDTKIANYYIQPIYLCHLLLDGLTLYFSDRNLIYPISGNSYEAYIKNLSDIESKIRSLGGYDNTGLTIEFMNKAITGAVTDLGYTTLIDLFDIYPAEKKYIEIYKLLIDTGETFVGDISTLIFKARWANLMRSMTHLLHLKSIVP